MQENAESGVGSGGMGNPAVGREFVHAVGKGARRLE